MDLDFKHSTSLDFPQSLHLTQEVWRTERVVKLEAKKFEPRLATHWSLDRGNV